MPPLRIIQLIPPLHTSLTHYAQAQPKAHKPRYKRYFKHTSNPRAKPKNAESHFCICNFFSQKSKIFANYSTIHAKQIILKAKTNYAKIATTSNVGGVWAAKSNKANVGRVQKA
ncbi:hypothetical protein [Helicobacter cinaedi]|uniref:hypothetical protein n=1 Tax=Helicobacter cinaedi TaxID=213 RepID=UPI000E0E5DBC|nr:hypothetical protein [Helicobacter cinaedi]